MDSKKINKKMGLLVAVFDVMVMGRSNVFKVNFTNGEQDGYLGIIQVCRYDTRELLAHTVLK